MAVLKIKDGNNWIEITGLTGGQGPQGPAGSDGSNGSNGNDGQDGITPTITITSIIGGHNVAFDYGIGDSRNVDFDVMDGSDGTNGSNGTTPVRGTDYWTQADITAIEGDLQSYINTQLGVIENGTY